MTNENAGETTAGGPFVPAEGPHAGRPNGLYVGPPDAPDEYELFGEGISGGEGTTWQARYRGDLPSPVPRAIKLLNRPPGLPGTWPSPGDLRRWKDQTVLLNHLQLDHVVRLYEIFRGAPPHPSGTADARDDVTYLAMEWVEGPTLDRLVRGEPANDLVIAQRMEYVVDVAQALGGLHSFSRSAGNPSLHRDVKPTNCIVHPERGVVLVDLSTMRLLDDGFDVSGLFSHGYAAPEVRRTPRAPREPSADLYALGALAVFCLLGEDPPPASAASVAVLEQRVAVVGHQAGVPDTHALAAHVVAMISPESESRPPDGVAWARRLVDLVSPRPRPDRSAFRATSAVARLRERRAVLGLSAAAVLALVLSLFLAFGSWGFLGSRTPAGPTETSVEPTPAASAATDAAVPLEEAAGTITSPVEDARVPQCSYFAGTAQIPAESTLVLAMQNLSNGQPEKYVEYVFGWDEPKTNWSWRGAQYFGQPSDTSGQRYRVELIAIDLRSAELARAAGGDAVNALASRGAVLDTRTVVRIGGAVPNNCEGP